MEENAIAIDIAGSAYDVTNLSLLMLTAGKDSTLEFIRSSRSYKNYGPTSQKALHYPIHPKVKCKKSSFNRPVLILHSSAYCGSHLEHHANSFEP